MNSAEFITMIWGGLPRGNLLLWNREQSMAMPFNSVDAAAAELAENEGSSPILSLASVNPEQNPPGRATAPETPDAIPGLHARILFDSTQPSHIPHAEHDAELLLAAMPVKPTVTVRTPTALEALWLFKEQWNLDTPKTAQTAETLAEWWNRKLLHAAHGRYVQPAPRPSLVRTKIAAPDTLISQEYANTVLTRLNGPKPPHQEFLRLAICDAIEAQQTATTLLHQDPDDGTDED